MWQSHVRQLLAVVVPAGLYSACPAVTVTAIGGMDPGGDGVDDTEGYGAGDALDALPVAPDVLLNR